MNRNEMLEKVKEQLSRDYNCSIEDFNKEENLITDYKLREGRRNYGDEYSPIKILVFGKKAIICVCEELREWCVEKLLNFSGEWIFSFRVLGALEKKLNDIGDEVDDTHQYYLPKENVEEIKPITKIKWYNQEEIKQFKDDERFNEAFVFDENYPDVLGVAALDEDDNIIGMAGASMDSENMWQIGINVFKGWEGKGIGTNLVYLIKQKILSLEKVPFYGTGQSHVISQNIAIKSGFYPAFSELKARKRKISNK